MKRSKRTLEVSVLVVAFEATLGLENAESELCAALTGLGVPYARAQVRLPRSIPNLAIGDILASLNTALAVRKAARSVDAQLIVYPTSLTALLAGRRTLAKSAVRFDALAAENRLGARNIVQRALERRALRLARVLLPWSLYVTPARRSLLPCERPIVSLPTVVDVESGDRLMRRSTVACYVANPLKKGLDLIVGAWNRMPHHGHRLVITGLTRAAGAAFLRSRGIDDPEDVEWAGVLPRDEYLRLLATAAIYVNGSRFEDFGAAQLEALASGCLLASIPTRGPIECLHVLRDIAPWLIAERQDASSLAEVLKAAITCELSTRENVRADGRAAAHPYSRDAFEARLRDHILTISPIGRRDDVSET